MSKHITIGVAVNSLFSEYQVEILRGIQSTAREKGVGIFCFVGGYLALGDENRFNSALRSMVYELISPENVDGLIGLSGSLVSQNSKLSLPEFYSKQKLPVVSIGSQIDGVPSITVDNRKGLHDILVHLIKDHNYRKIAFIKGVDGVPDAEERFHVYKEVLKEYGIPFNPDLVAPGDFWKDKAREAIHLLFNTRKADIDAVVGVNDITAITVLDEIRDGRLKPPHFLAVTGFDNTFQSELPSVGLTTVTQPSYEMGRKAIELILDLIEGKKIEEKTILPTKSVIRRSCGCKDSRKEKPAPENIYPDQAASSQWKEIERREESIVRQTGLFESMNIINMSLAGVMSMEELRQIFHYLKQLNIDAYYLVLYPDIKCRCLVLDSGHKEGRDFPQDDTPYPREKLVPDYIRLSQPGSFHIIIPLYFEKKQLGFIIFETRTSDYFILEFMGTQLSNILKRNELFKYFRDHTLILEEEVQKRTKEINEMQQKLIESAYNEGAAEIASLSVHNIGNILNTVLTQINHLGITASNSPIDKLKKANTLVRPMIEQLNSDDSITSKLKLLVEYYMKIEELFVDEHKMLFEEFNALEKSIQKIEASVEFQREYTYNEVNAETIDLLYILEKTIQLGKTQFFLPDIIIEKRYSPDEKYFISGKSSKLLYILVNILKNANTALQSNDDNNKKKQITISLKQEAEQVILSIEDNGHGIEKQDLKKIFNYGYSTNSNARGFGLHICANFITEMKGSISVDSPGLGSGTIVHLAFIKNGHAIP